MDVGIARVGCCMLLLAAAVTRAAGGSVPVTEAYPQPPEVGQPAPALHFDKMLQTPEGTKVDWASLRGKVVVLEFWSTKCRPCIQWLPHLNKIEKKFHDKPIVFISITDDDEKTVRRFLRKKKMRGWIALDGDLSVKRSYGTNALPATVIVGPDGNLAGWAHPSDLVAHPEMLLEVLAGKKPTDLSATPNTRMPYLDLVAEFGPDKERASEKKLNRPLFQILIRRSNGGQTPYPMPGSSKWRYSHAVTVRSALADAFDIPAAYIVSDNPSLDDEKYDILFRRESGSFEGARKILQSALQNTFALTIKREMRATDVYVLGYPKEKKPHWEPAVPQFITDMETGNTAPTREILERQNRGEQFFMAVGDTAALVLNLCGALGRPVLDEANIEGYYLFYFPLSRSDPDAATAIKSIREKYGLTLTPGKRSVEVLVVD